VAVDKVRAASTISRHIDQGLIGWVDEGLHLCNTLQ
jgi:hypothetical protein